MHEGLPRRRTPRSILTNLVLGSALTLSIAVSLAGCGAEPGATLSEGARPGPGVVGRADGTGAVGPRVVFLGDSLAAGLHLPAEEAFPAVLERRLAAAGLPFRLQNAGVSGDTTAGGLSRLDWLLRQGPDLLVVELGSNDGLRGLPLATIESNLRAILDAARAAELPVLLLGMVLPPNYGAEYRDGFAAIYDRLAAEYEVEYRPFFVEGVGGVPELNLPDGLHPTAEGHRRLADNIEPLLERILRRIGEAEAEVE